MLQDRTILVTGAARGLGREIALALARQGAKLILADINTDGGIETQTLINNSGGVARFNAVDLGDPQ